MYFKYVFQLLHYTDPHLETDRKYSAIEIFHAVQFCGIGRE